MTVIFGEHSQVMKLCNDTMFCIAPNMALSLNFILVTGRNNYLKIYCDIFH